MNIETTIWMYWLFCATTMILIAQYRKTIVAQLLSPNFINPNSNSVRIDNNYPRVLGLGWVATLLAAISYIIFAHKTITGSYQMSDLIIFSVSNGILEQFMFLFWLLVGCYLAKRWLSQRPSFIFIAGYLSFTLFSGLIHALFWKPVLPPHEPNTLVIILMLSIMSLAWMWLFWRYRVIIPIVAMHIFLDFVMISYLHSNWVEACQAFIQRI